MVGARADRQRGRSLLRVATIGVTILTTGTGALLSGAVPAFAAGQTRFVAPTGDDTDNDCLMQEAPCLTIQHAVDRADPTARRYEVRVTAAWAWRLAMLAWWP